MNRRSFIGSILALSAAPAIVRADSLMRIVPRDTTIILRGDLANFRFGLGDWSVSGICVWNGEQWAAVLGDRLRLPMPPDAQIRPIKYPNILTP